MTLFSFRSQIVSDLQHPQAEVDWKCIADYVWIVGVGKFGEGGYFFG